MKSSGSLDQLTTSMAGCEAAVEGMLAMENLDVISVQEMHAQLAA